MTETDQMSPAADGMSTVLEYLTSIPAWYLATSVDNQPHVRPFSFAAEQDGKIWFCTATTKDVWQELVANQLFEATAWWPGHGWLILRGRALPAVFGALFGLPLEFDLCGAAPVAGCAASPTPGG